MSENDPTLAKLIRVGHPAVRLTLKFEPVVPLDGPVTEGPLIRVAGPLIRCKLTFVPVSSYIVMIDPLFVEHDSDRVLDDLSAIVGKLNELEAIFHRPGVRIDHARSGIRDGKLVLVVLPNDPTNSIETCKRVADFLFAIVRPISGAIVRVISADEPDKTVYELAA